MLKYIFPVIILFSLLLSCVTMSETAPDPEPEQTAILSSVPVQPEIQPPAVIPDPTSVPPEIPPPSVNIMGRGRVPAEKLVLFLLQNNSDVNSGYVKTLAVFYIDEAVFEGINHDTAFAQMCLETGFLKYGGLVRPDWNNFCGLGAIGPGQPGEIFPDPRTGVRAHIQHLKAYATTEPLKGALVDPRYRYVRKGSSPTINGLSGTWATDKSYSSKIYSILQRMYEFSF
ncbi:MAG: glucosaminidase domain-containing protein [Treponema sp.]|jgi:hypothetical protein|nr:glucosaminidase domain-containing protein [Treponema sp.]